MEEEEGKEICYGITIYPDGVSIAYPRQCSCLCYCGDSCDWCFSLYEYCVELGLRCDGNASRYFIEGMTQKQIEDFLQNGYTKEEKKEVYPKSVKECWRCNCADCGFHTGEATKEECCVHEALVAEERK